MDSHPIATPEQHAHELEAARADAAPDRAGSLRARARRAGSTAVDPSPDDARLLRLGLRGGDVLGRDLVARTRIRCARKVICITRLAHALDGARIPGSRWGIDNPDSIYRVIPISGSERYVIRGRVAERRMTENYFTLWDEKMNTVDVLSGHDLVIDADGRFTITVDSDPAGDRPNHVRSAPEAHEFYIRDVMLDWARDEPNELDDRAPRRRRPTTPPRTRRRAGRAHGRATCTASPTSPRSSRRGMTARAAQPVRARLLGRQGRRAAQAGLHRRQLHARRRRGDGDRRERRRRRATSWCRSGTSGARRSTSSTAPAASTRRSPIPNADGTYTYVLVAHAIRACTTGSTPAASARASSRCAWRSSRTAGRATICRRRAASCRSRACASELPAETRWVTRAERAAQLAERAAAYARRLPER